jgi:hypothetical protein
VASLAVFQFATKKMTSWNVCGQADEDGSVGRSKVGRKMPPVSSIKAFCRKDCKKLDSIRIRLKVTGVWTRTRRVSRIARRLTIKSWPDYVAATPPTSKHGEKLERDLIPNFPAKKWPETSESSWWPTNAQNHDWYIFSPERCQSCQLSRSDRGMSRRKFFPYGPSLQSISSRADYFWLVLIHGIFDMCIVKHGSFTLASGAQFVQGDILVRLLLCISSPLGSVRGRGCSRSGGLTTK